MQLCQNLPYLEVPTFTMEGLCFVDATNKCTLVLHLSGVMNSYTALHEWLMS